MSLYENAVTQKVLTATFFSASLFLAGLAQAQTGQMAQECVGGSATTLTFYGEGFASGSYRVLEYPSTVVATANNEERVTITGTIGQFYYIEDSTGSPALAVGPYIPGVVDCTDQDTCDVGEFFDVAELGFTGSLFAGGLNNNGNFNALIEGNFSSNGTGDTEGRLAVGGDFSNPGGASSYTVGGGALSTGGPNAPYGWDNFLVAGDFTGRVGVRGNSILNTTGLLDIYQIGATYAGLELDAELVISDYLDIPAAINYFRNESLCLSDTSEGSPGTVTSNASIFTLDGKGHSGLVVFDLANYSPNNNYDFVNVENASAILVNVGGLNVDISGGQITNEGSAITFPLTGTDLSLTNKLLWNFHEAQNFELNSFNFIGSLLATNTTTVTLAGGAINGQVVFGGDVTQSGGFEFHNFCFLGDLTCDTCELLAYNPLVLDLERYPAGRIIDDEFTLELGVTVSGETGNSGNPGYVVLYDSTTVGGADPDLEGPPSLESWEFGNAAGYIAGNLLVVQENGPNAAEIAAGQLSTNAPDDQGGGGVIQLDFDVPLGALRFYWVDLDTISAATVRFIDTVNDNEVAVNFTNFTTDNNIFYDPTLEFGDRSFDFLREMTVEQLSTFDGSDFTRIDRVRFEMQGSGSAAHVDFQPLFQGCIGDFVWSDLDGDGAQDIGEPGIQGVTVDLFVDNGDGIFDANTDTLFRRHTTDANGGYNFVGLPPENFWVTVSDLNGVVTGSTLTGGSNPHFINLPLNGRYSIADFGYNQPSGLIGDQVFDDVNANGVFDSGELGIQQVTLALYRDEDNDGNVDLRSNDLDTDVDTLVAVTTTDENGIYQFANLPAGDYLVTVTDENNAVNQGGITTSAGDPIAVTLGVNQTVLTADFGYNQANGSIGDRVWNDLDGDGIQDPAEPGFANVTVELWSDRNNDGIFDPVWGDVYLGRQATDGNGNYLFTGLVGDSNTSNFDTEAYFVVVTDENKVLGSSAVLTTSQEPYYHNLLANQAFLNADFGYQFGASSIGDFVWNDVDGDGVQDPGELGLSNVTVDLYIDEDNDGVLDLREFVNDFDVDTFVRRITTNASGGYDFTNLGPENYLVVVSDVNGVINGALTTGNQPMAVALAGGQDFNTADFGYQQGTASIGDFVFLDANGNNQFDIGEPGLSNITVDLWLDTNNNGIFDSQTDTLINQQTTSATGAYDFTGLAAGTYFVTVSDENNLLTNSTLSVGSDPLTVVLKIAQDFNDADFGYTTTDGLIGDLVWNDMNGNSIVDFGETGIENITVELFQDVNEDGLLDSGDTFLELATTNSNGNYSFFGLPAGKYLVVSTDKNNVIDGNLTTNNNPLAVDLGFNEIFLTADFGYKQFSSIGDTVYNDANNNGSQDAGELGIASATVALIFDENNNGIIDLGELAVRTAETGPDGKYLFDRIGGGHYIVTVTDTLSVINGILSGGIDPMAISLAPGEENLTADFGYHQGTASIGDFVWNDNDGDGIQDGGEPGIGDVTVDLVRDLNGNGVQDPDDVLIARAKTDNNGAYDFTGLPAGSYLVSVSDIDNSISGPATTPSLVPVTITSGQDFNDADFGFEELGSIGDLVWNDVDADGLLDSGEAGLGGVTLDLINDVNGNGSVDPGDNVIDTVTTNINGLYRFTDLPSGDYIVQVSDTNNVLTGSLTTGNEPLPVELGAGEDFDDADFGYNQVGGSIGDQVFDDNNTNGTFDSGDVGIVNVVVELYRDVNNNGSIDGGDIALGTTTTNGTGIYSFGGLPAGDYLVLADPSNAIVGTLTTGSNPIDVTLSNNQDLDTADFGYDTVSATIGDLVWNDVDGSGDQGFGETGIDNVTLALYLDIDGDGLLDPTDTFLSSTVTAGDGSYEFDGLLAGKYLVEVTDNNSVVDGLILVSGTDPFAVTLASGQQFMTADFGYVSCSAGSDVVLEFRYRMTFNSGFENNEYIDAMASFDGSLLGNEGSGNNTRIERVTGADNVTDTGWQTFSINLGNIPGGSYDLDLGGFVNQSTASSEDAEVFFDDVTITRNSVTTTIEDFDPADGSSNGVYGAFTYSDDFFRGTSQASKATFIEPNGSNGITGGGLGVFMGDNGGSGNGISGAWSATITVPNANSIIKSSLGDRVWLDANRSTFIETGEVGLANVTVELWRDNNNNNAIDLQSDTLIGKTLTDANGFYLFTCLDSATYMALVTDENNVTDGLFLTNTVNPRVTNVGAQEDVLFMDFGYADDPLTLVELISFSAEVDHATGQPLIRWETAAEFENVGFQLYYLDDSNGHPRPGRSVTQNLIPAAGNPVQGAVYTYLDSNSPGKVDQDGYYLKDIDLSGKETYHGPVYLKSRTTGIEDWFLLSD